MDTNIFIVPHDFTNVGDSALKYALFIAKQQKAAIKLLHIIDKNDQSDFAKNKLDEIIRNLDLSVGDVSVESLVIKGNIFEDIPKIAEENKARLIIMGTHGAIGMQKIFGSFAMKVITNTNLPFLVVQEGVRNYKLDNIVVPITISKESLQVTSVVIDIAKVFNSKVHVIAEKPTDEGLLQKIKIRASLVEKQLKEYEIESRVDFIPQKRSFSKSIIDYTKTNKFDMIAVAQYSDSLFPQFERYTQNLITNSENIPCLVINSKLMTKLSY